MNKWLHTLYIYNTLFSGRRRKNGSFF